MQRSALLLLQLVPKNTASPKSIPKIQYYSS